MFSQKAIKPFHDSSQVLENCHIITEWKTSALSPFIFHSDFCAKRIFTKTVKEPSFRWKINAVFFSIIAG